MQRLRLDICRRFDLRRLLHVEGVRNNARPPLAVKTGGGTRRRPLGGSETPVPAARTSPIGSPSVALGQPRRWQRHDATAFIGERLDHAQQRRSVGPRCAHHQRQLATAARLSPCVANRDCPGRLRSFCFRDGAESASEAQASANAATIVGHGFDGPCGAPTCCSPGGAGTISDGPCGLPAVDDGCWGAAAAELPTPGRFHAALRDHAQGGSIRVEGGSPALPPA
mmetsp:Transcript_48254/g.134716  ORF Transcript_48254/g.134716 Transcript_48254/m.134716 type:complete len:225 (-) Transcript_48254:405-1079(-)